MDVRYPAPFARLLAFALLAAALAGCGREEQAADSMDAHPAPEMVAVDEPEAPESSDADASVNDRGFDLASVPASAYALGDFPFIVLPEGYEAINQQTLNVARVPFWTGDRLEQVEGKAFMATIQEAQGSTYSEFEFERNIEHVIKQAGGVLVTDSAIPADILETVAREDRVGLVDGWGDVYNNPVQTYVVRTDDRTVWVHVCSSSAGAGLIVLEAQAFVPTAKLLSVDTLRQQLDAAGKVAIEVNFATDKADILPDSQPQIAEVIQLLQQDTALELSVNGHTDDTGGAAYNQALSEARAQAVVAALTAGGIEASRLQSRGFGQDQPVADNGNEAGRAQNRRVELVKRE